MAATVKELRAKCKAAGIKGYSKLRKAELLKALAAVETYDAADNSAKCYDVAIIAMRDKLASFRKEVIGECTLYLGDCREILPLLPRFDAVVTDPPYGVTYQSNAGSGRGTAPITNDGTRVSLKLYRDIVPRLGLTPTLWFTRWDAWVDVWDIFGQTTRTRGLLIWDKGTPGMGDLSHWGLSYEMVVSAGDVVCRGGRDNSVIRLNGVPSGNRYHPTEKPIELMRYLVEKITDAGHQVFDPFMGSGTTGVACAKLGRRFIGVEIEPKYFDIAVRRIEEAYKQPDMFVAPPRAPAEQMQLIAAE